MSSTTRAPRRLPPLPPLPAGLAFLVAFVAFASAQAPSAVAERPAWSAGERATVTTPAGPTVAAALVARVAGYERALGLDAVAGRQVAVVEDRFHGRVVHEVTELDARGRPIGLMQLEPEGRLVAAVRLGFLEAFAAGDVGGAEAASAADRLLRALSLERPAGAPTVELLMNGGLWSVSWTRLAGGAPVPGDGITVRVWRSGDIHSVTLIERPLDPPAERTSAADARRTLDDLLPRLMAAERRADASIGPPELRWVAGNDVFRAEAPDAPAPVLRLAHVFEIALGGESADLLRAVAVWLDAESGELLGGDILR